MAWSALFKADLLQLSKSWVLRGWIIALAFAELFAIAGLVAASRVTPIPASTIVATQLILYLVVWSTVIIVLSAGSVSLETDMIADSILSRACTRTQYMASKLISRAVVILGVYLVFGGISTYAAWRYAANDMTPVTMLTAIAIVGLAILLLVTLGVATSVVFNNTIVAVIALLLVWYVASPVFSFLGADYLSPASLTRNLPLMLKDSNAPQVVESHATPTSLTVVFSKDVDSQKAERPENYALEVNGQTANAAPTAVYDSAKTTVILSGLALQPADSVKVTVRGVTDKAGNDISPAADSATATVPEAKAEGEKGSSGAGEATAVQALHPNPNPNPNPNPPSASGPTPSAQRPTPARIRGGDRTPPRVLGCTATASSLKVTFSKAMDVKDAETLANYIIESPIGKVVTARAATYTPDTHAVLLSGLQLSSGDPVKVTVKDARDADGIPMSTKANSATYTEVTTWKYVLGFAIPAVFAGLLAIVWFSRRDL